MEMIYLNVNGIKVSLQSHSNPVLELLLKNYEPWITGNDGESPHVNYLLTETRELPALPSGCVRTRYDLKIQEYRFGKQIFDIIPGEYLAKKNYLDLNVKIYVNHLGPIAISYALSAFKWLLIKAQEKQGTGVIHASAAHLKGKTIVFSGPSCSGKSSCLARLVSKGAEIISDDTLLFDGTQLIPFDPHPTIRGDFAERFFSKCDLKNKWGNFFSTQSNFRGIDIVVFPHVWVNPGTEVTSLSKTEALDLLMKEYIHEMKWHAYPEKLEPVQKKYEALIENSSYFSLYVGQNESMAEQKLLTLF